MKKSMSKKNIMIAILVILLIVVVACFILVSKKEWKSGNINYGAMGTSIVTFGLIITAVYGFYVTNKYTRLQTSMDFCLSMFQTFQSEEYIQREQLIWKGLEERGDNYCAIEEIEDTVLQHAVYEYCELMNGVGVLVLGHMIDPDIVVAYLGANTLKTYCYIKPYLDRTRQSRVARVPGRLPKVEMGLIREAETMAFAHFELLVLEIKKQAPKTLRHYEKKLDKARKKSN